jgi:hypothetical protein
MQGRLLLPLIILISYLPPVISQRPGSEVVAAMTIANPVLKGLFQADSLKRPAIILSREQSIKLLQKHFQIQHESSKLDLFTQSIGRLIDNAGNPSFDSTKYFLQQFNYDSIKIFGKESDRENKFRVKIPDDTIYRINSVLHTGKKDSVSFPEYPTCCDSVKAAVDVLLNYLEDRDSSVITFSGISNRNYHFWLNSKSDKMLRFWLKNELNDSVTVWIGNPDRNTIGLYLEHGVSFLRPSKQANVSEARIDIKPQDNSKLVGIHKILTKSQFWKYRTEASFALNQGLVTNWVKGGENSVSTALDVTWFADYSNPPMLLSSSHFARVKYGLIASGTDGIRKNIDLLETNSKINHKAFGKFDFSGIMLLKTQVSRGYNYPNDSVPVSKFMNPVIITLGFGLDYKPEKFTSINFSPLSYKVTFVSDTASIDQTRYGIPINRKALHEPGASFMISNEFRPVKNMAVTTRLQLFTNYIHNPLNIDVDWEMILQANLNWFTDVRLNTHLIFDDDTKTPVFDRNKNPVLGNDGLQKKTARIQFKELLGLSFIFRF